MIRFGWLACLGAGTLSACGGPGGPGDHGDPDATPARDATRRDAGAEPPSMRWFEDVTVAAGIRFVRRPAEGYGTMADRIGGGVCVLDADGSAPLDLFFAVRPDGRVRSRLYVARGVLDYRDETAARGLSDVGDALGCLAFDAEGDGDDDLLVTGKGDLRLYLNDRGHFDEAAGSFPAAPDAAGLYTSAAAGDVDGDGDLDLLVAGFVDAHTEGTETDCAGVPCAVEAGRHAPIADLLLRREDDGRYVDVAPTLAPALAEAEPTLAVAIDDLDGDGRPDLYVGNDLGETYRDRALLLDASGVFVDEAERLGLAYDARGSGVDTMGWTSGDLDGDGVLDHAATAFEGFPSPVFLCRADGPCEERGEWLGTGSLAGTFRWGDALVDVDLDGDVDLLEAAGHIYTDAEGEAIGFPVAHAQPMNLMLNAGDGHLTAVEPLAGDALGDPHPARGIAIADLDDDGRPDVVLGTTLGAPVVLHNVAGRRGRWLRVLLRGAAPNPSAVGARVEVRQGGRLYVRGRRAGEGFLGSFDPRLLFGLAGGGRVDVTVRWPDGAVRTVQHVEPDREIVIDQR